MCVNKDDNMRACVCVGGGEAGRGRGESVNSHKSMFTYCTHVWTVGKRIRMSLKPFFVVFVERSLDHISCRRSSF